MLPSQSIVTTITAIVVHLLRELGKLFSRTQVISRHICRNSNVPAVEAVQERLNKRKE